MTAPAPTPGYRMNVLIRRRAGVTRDELVANWFANHMPGVVRAMASQALAGRPHAHRYIATLFDAEANASPAWDGIAQLWWNENLPKPTVPHGTQPVDTFQQKAQPYLPWMVREYVVLDGRERLAHTPNTLNEPFPFTRSGFFKLTFLAKLRSGADADTFFAHWLNVHAEVVRAAMEASGGYRYVIAHSVDPKGEDFAGMAELYFPDRASFARFGAEMATKPDDLAPFADREASLSFTSGTEMVGIPG